MKARIFPYRLIKPCRGNQKMIIFRKSLVGISESQNMGGREGRDCLRLFQNRRKVSSPYPHISLLTPPSRDK